MPRLTSSLALLLTLVLALHGCAMDDAASEGPGFGRGDIDDGAVGSPGPVPPPTSEGGGLTSDGGGEGSGGEGEVQAGTLTAGASDDNRNFEHFETFLLENGQEPGLPPFTDDERADAYAAFGGDRAGHTHLDVALVVDTTGSMGDEIRYLQAELTAIAERIEAAYAAATRRYALIVYRDRGDAYVTRVFDFTSDVDELSRRLNEESANGGGDFPEAVDAALRDAAALSWSEGAATARLAFWVADAPHHMEVADEVAAAVRRAAERDVHLYPVASSGVDLRTEITMRSAAQLTGGRYLFLTDDSGVGGSHLEPSIPCYFVTRLDSAMMRMVEIEMTGVYREPAADEIIRTGGDPEDGFCTLESGDEVEIF